MTSSPDMPLERVSAERLSERIAQLSELTKHGGQPHEEDDLSALTELRERRSPSPGAGERVRELEWENIDNTSMWASIKPLWMCYRISLRADRMKSLRLEWLGNRNDELGIFADWDEAKAAAQADYEQRILFALRSALPDGGAREPGGHAIIRTSPKGEKFVGTCSRCGKAGLTTADLNEPCSNTRQITDDEALIEAIDEPDFELEAHAQTARKLLDNPTWTPTRLLWSRLAIALEKALCATPASGRGIEEAAWQEITHENRPFEAEYERDQLQKRIKQFGPWIVVDILTTYALGQPPQGSFAGSLWALAEWAETVNVARRGALTTPKGGAGDADGWIAWHGGECPVPEDTQVQPKFRIDKRKRNIENSPCPAGGLRWSHRISETNAGLGDIVAYRIVPATPTEESGG